MTPKCKCGRPCAYYGPVGGYSVKCETCNARKSALARASRKRIKEARPTPQPAAKEAQS